MKQPDASIRTEAQFNSEREETSKFDQHRHVSCQVPVQHALCSRFTGSLKVSCFVCFADPEPLFLPPAPSLCLSTPQFPHILPRLLGGPAAGSQPGGARPAGAGHWPGLSHARGHLGSPEDWETESRPGLEHPSLY